MTMTLLLMAIALWESDEMSIKFAFISLIEALRFALPFYAEVKLGQFLKKFPWEQVICFLTIRSVYLKWLIMASMIPNRRNLLVINLFNIVSF